MTPTTTTACIACRLPPKDPNAPSGNLVRDDNISANYAYVFLRISVQRIGFVYSQPAQTHLTTSCQDRRKSSKTGASGPRPSSQYPAKTRGNALCQDSS